MNRRWGTLVIISLIILFGSYTVDDLVSKHTRPPETLSELEADYPSADAPVQVERPIGKTETVTLERVVDGDTLKVRFKNGVTESVRLLLVDTPETSHPNLPVQPFGEDAKSFVQRWLHEGKEILLEYDVGRYDRYQRTLAYVWVDGSMLNEQLLRRGLGRVAYVYAPNTQHLDDFRETEQSARLEELGIWSLENYVTDRGFDHERVNSGTRESRDVTNECDIKGNINSSGEKIFHVPGGASYEQTIPEVIFCTEKEADEAGFRKATR